MLRHAGKHATLNDLNSSELARRRARIVDENSKTFKKHFTKIERCILRGSMITNFFYSNQEIISNEIQKTSVFRFSINPITVTLSLDLLSDLLLACDLRAQGIFRVNSMSKNIMSLVEIVTGIGLGRIDEDIGRRIIVNGFDQIDISESYKALFKKFEKPVIPKHLHEIGIKIQNIQDAEEKRICAQAFLYSLPKNNRMILENCVFVCTIISERLAELPSKEKMNLKGLGVVMMPNLAKPILEFNTIKVLSDFVCYIFENFMDLAMI